MFDRSRLRALAIAAILHCLLIVSLALADANAASPASSGAESIHRIVKDVITEDDIQQAARAFTGYKIDPRDLLRLDCLSSASCGMGMSDHVRGKEFQLRTLVEALRIGEPSRVARALSYYAAGYASIRVTSIASPAMMNVSLTILLNPASCSTCP